MPSGHRHDSPWLTPSGHTHDPSWLMPPAGGVTASFFEWVQNLQVRVWKRLGVGGGGGGGEGAEPEVCVCLCMCVCVWGGGGGMQNPSGASAEEAVCVCVCDVEPCMCWGCHVAERQRYGIIPPGAVLRTCCCQTSSERACSKKGNRNFFLKNRAATKF